MIAMLLIRTMCGRRLILFFIAVLVRIVGIVVVVAVRIRLGRTAAIARRVVLCRVNKKDNERARKKVAIEKHTTNDSDVLPSPKIRQRASRQCFREPDGENCECWV